MISINNNLNLRTSISEAVNLAFRVKNNSLGLITPGTAGQLNLPQGVTLRAITTTRRDVGNNVIENRIQLSGDTRQQVLPGFRISSDGQYTVSREFQGPSFGVYRVEASDGNTYNLHLEPRFNSSITEPFVRFRGGGVSRPHIIPEGSNISFYVKRNRDSDFVHINPQTATLELIRGLRILPSGRLVDNRFEGSPTFEVITGGGQRFRVRTYRAAAP